MVNSEAELGSTQAPYTRYAFSKLSQTHKTWTAVIRKLQRQDLNNRAASLRSGPEAYTQKDLAHVAARISNAIIMLCPCTSNSPAATGPSKNTSSTGSGELFSPSSDARCQSRSTLVD